MIIYFFCKCDVCVSVVTINKMLIITKHFWTVCQRLTEITPLYSDCQILKTHNCSIFINFAVIFFKLDTFKLNYCFKNMTLISGFVVSLKNQRKRYKTNKILDSPYQLHKVNNFKTAIRNQIL